MKWIAAFLAFVVLAFQYAIWFDNGGLRGQRADLLEKVAQMQQQNHELREQNERLAAEVRDLNNGYDAAAEIARSHLGYVGKGEVFIRFEQK